ncbi:MAG: type II toxin-antitoxin system RelE/ParE family toxin [Rhodospirillales bacterium]|nr:type II toxin-antitoxin system RelE/ParE family toxin [Rhodospirillales bacterium]
MFEIAYSSAALRSLKRLPADHRRQIRDKIASVAADPTGDQPQVKPLKGIDAYRLRVGKWRVLFDLDHDAEILIVLDVRKRDEAYR